MIKEIAEIKEEELNKIIEESKREILSLEKDKLPPVLEELRRLTALDKPRNFNWFQKNITKRNEYQSYIQEAQENKVRIPVLSEDIEFLKNTIAHKKKVIGDTERKIIRSKVASSLDELGITDFNQALELLKSNNKNIIIDEKDILNTQVSTRFQDLSSFAFIYKTNKLADVPTMYSRADNEEFVKSEILIGDAFKYVTAKSGEKTVHGTINCVDKNYLSNYAVIAPFDSIDKTRLVSAAPNNTFFDSEVTIPNESYILVPANELDFLNQRKENYPDINIFGYTGNINKVLSVLMNNLGYSEQEIKEIGWENKDKLYEYQDLVEEIINNESKIDIKDIVDRSAKNTIVKNRFVPYSYTNYFSENSVRNKKNQFGKAIESLYKNIDEFDLEQKKLKTRTTVSYDQDLLNSDPKDKSGDVPVDVFTDFVDILISRSKENIDDYIKDIDPKLIPNKEEFRDELLKASSRLKNHIPIRDKLFTNLFERFVDLEVELNNNKVDEVKESSTPVIEETMDDIIIEEEVQEMPLDTSMDDIVFEDDLEIVIEDNIVTKDDKEVAIEIGEETDIDLEELEREKTEMISKLKKMEEAAIEDDLEIIIEGMKEERE